MKIVQVVPNIIPIPGSGGIERVAYNLSDELVRRGHEVYVYALAGSESKAIIIPYGHRGFSKNNIKDFVIQTLPDDIDVIHDHTHDLVIGREYLDVPTVSTIHTEWGLKISVKCPVYVSKTKLLQSPNKKRGAYVHNGIDLDAYAFEKKKGDYLLFLGRIDREKGVEDAIKLAERTGMRTIIAGPIWDRKLFSELHPRIEKASNISYVGEVHGVEKQNLLMHAKWLLFPTACEEQFGLVLIEAMACGTPVAAYGRGAVPEVLQGLPQFICANWDEMKRLIKGKSLVSPEELREYVAMRYTKGKMTDKYLELYARAIKGWK
ncbi:glycosyltransferase [Paenibacillus nasutitermitis]|uniref:Glycosyl transferase n=1 Tax=Paenibacillus nasutitermitis TaxID=1652958 RepID=A0A916Z5X2_9BACL|nr:glycosyltransferase [Paenibacillus nasutitermitis]GGD75553.1 glycosyl transferase [Paenibacillus nasutitermitis]